MPFMDCEKIKAQNPSWKSYHKLFFLRKKENKNKTLQNKNLKMVFLIKVGKKNIFRVKLKRKKNIFLIKSNFHF